MAEIDWGNIAAGVLSGGAEAFGSWLGGKQQSAGAQASQRIAGEYDLQAQRERLVRNPLQWQALSGFLDRLNQPVNPVVNVRTTNFSGNNPSLESKKLYLINELKKLGGI